MNGEIINLVLDRFNSSFGDFRFTACSRLTKKGDIAQQSLSRSRTGVGIIMAM